MRIICWIKGHNDHIDKVWDGVHVGAFVSFGMCRRCKRQWWMKGETGYMKGVRFVRSPVEME